VRQRKGAVSEGIIRDPTTCLGPYPQSTIPTARTEGHTIGADTQAADAVFVASQDTDALSLERIPNIARPIIVSTKQDAPRDREGN